MGVVADLSDSTDGRRDYLAGEGIDATHKEVCRMSKLRLEHAHIDCSVLKGHFLTASEAAAQVGLSTMELEMLPGVVQIPGPHGTEAAYPDFQFNHHGGFVPGLREVVSSLDESIDGPTLCGLLVAPQPKFGGSSVLDWLSSGNSSAAVIDFVHSVVDKD